MSRRPVSVLVAVLAAALTVAVLGGAGAPAAKAAPGVRYGLTDDAWLLDGPGSVASRVARLQALGVEVVRFTLRWDQIAARQPKVATNPNDLAYDWTQDDQVLRALHARRIDVVLQLVGVPAWANGGRASNYAPLSGSTFAAFATAAARHYRWVKRWVIWNEPNQRRWLIPTSPVVYSLLLLNPAYRALHATIPGVQVAGGSTAPRAATGGVSPVAWIVGMHRAGARLDAYAHNPYPLDPKRETPRSGGCFTCQTITMATISRLVSLVEHNFGRARIWLTEYGYQSDPPDPFLGVPLSLQARYIGDGALAAYLAPRVDMLIQFLYQDEPTLARFQSGLVTVDGKPKPALAAFALPLTEWSRRGTRTTLWGQLRAPAAGRSAQLQEEVGGVWRPVATLRATSRGFVRWTGTLPAGSTVRLRARRYTSPWLAIS